MPKLIVTDSSTGDTDIIGISQDQLADLAANGDIIWDANDRPVWPKDTIVAHDTLNTIIMGQEGAEKNLAIKHISEWEFDRQIEPQGHMLMAASTAQSPSGPDHILLAILVP